MGLSYERIFKMLYDFLFYVVKHSDDKGMFYLLRVYNRSGLSYPTIRKFAKLCVRLGFLRELTDREIIELKQKKKYSKSRSYFVLTDFGKMFYQRLHNIYSEEGENE